jgi:riboflavin kinase/FMN adenylyltransferase
LLGRPYEVLGPIVPGRGIGRTQTVPTYNMAPYPEQLPSRGVYITTTNGVPSVTNIGHNPTFGETELHLESHLLQGPATEAKEMRVRFHWQIRDERKFSSPEELRLRIGRDIAMARRYFGTTDKHR